jgi:hypothetical protein
MLKRFFLASAIILCSFFSRAQFQSIALDYGQMYYIGDIQPSLFPDFQFLNSSWGANYRFSPGYKFSIGASFLYGKLHGSDDWNGIEKTRNLDFRTDIYDFSLNMRYYFIVENRKASLRGRSKFNQTPIARIFLGIGGGAFLFSPEGTKDDAWIPLRDLGTEGQFIKSSEEYQYPKPYNQYAFNLKYTLGVEVKIIEQLAVEFYFRFNQTFTDYLDDVSQSYPDAVALVNSTIPTAKDMSFKGEGAFPARGTRRGSKVGNDHFLNFGISIVHRFGFY